MDPELSQFERPFLVHHLRQDESSKDYTPTARLHLTAFARTSGFIRVLSGTEARMLLALMTYLTPNGETRVTATQVARALGVPTPVAVLWLRNLSHTRFQGEPIVERLKSPEALTAYTLSHSLVHHDVQPQKRDPPVIQFAAGRQAVIEHVRSTYATPKVEAERTVMHHLGLHPEELQDSDDAHVWRELRYLRFKRADIQALIDTFGIGKIATQLEWLAERRPKDRARTLVSALMNDWGPPKRLRDVLATGKFANQNSEIKTTNENLPITKKGEYDE